jgi:hypothetical protein
METIAGPTQNKTTNNYIYTGIGIGLVLLIGIPGMIKLNRVMKNTYAKKRETSIVLVQKNPLVIRTVSTTIHVCERCQQQLTSENFSPRVLAKGKYIKCKKCKVDESQEIF